ncbi:XRE family transcriptional regulator [Paenarthrobacter sp. PH39-S1]|uniref:helix-turn-helix domain-containing protein n=1 Tax=Paenarthrobacter sp. PH39-S1 TaxID=3046204 RepID=UPI0024BAFF29|nr:XRE family transcriptional regulator [Paenarthrobacter sp. PH39-S1]MDJ0358261.1 XRE family transcriptional regulator [Paenarthrobacter sp. PH39-S1]
MTETTKVRLEQKADVVRESTTPQAAEEAVTEGGGEAMGARIRSARMERGMSLREMSRRLDISAGHISQVERGLVTPSITLIYAIAAELSLGVSDLFGDNANKNSGSENIARTRGEENFVTRAGERRSIDLETGVRWELLTPTRHEPVDFREIVYPIGAGSEQPGGFVRHSGHEYGLLIAGVLRVQLDFEEYELGPGDSIAFDSMIPHRFWNDGAETVRAVWCMVESTPGESCAF